jgi:hypothetical protein
LDDNTNTVKKNTGAMTGASRVVGLEVNIRRTKCIVVCRHRIAGQKHNLLTVNKYFESAAKVIYLGTTATNQNYIHEDI